MKLLLLDMDNTIRETISGATFINDLYDQKLIAGVDEILRQYNEWVKIGITNQGGVIAGHKTLENAIAEQEHTLELVELEAILFCPDQGETCWVVEQESMQHYQVRVCRLLNDAGAGNSFPS